VLFLLILLRSQNNPNSRKAKQVFIYEPFSNGKKHLKVIKVSKMTVKFLFSLEISWTFEKKLFWSKKSSAKMQTEIFFFEWVSHQTIIFVFSNISTSKMLSKIILKTNLRWKISLRTFRKWHGKTFMVNQLIIRFSQSSFSCLITIFLLMRF